MQSGLLFLRPRNNNLLELLSISDTEPYIPENARMRNFGPVTVPEGHVFVMGDNRRPGMSTDSRSFGTIPESDIIGKAFIRVWPPSRWGGL